MSTPKKAKAKTVEAPVATTTIAVPENAEGTEQKVIAVEAPEGVNPEAVEKIAQEVAEAALRDGAAIVEAAGSGNAVEEASTILESAAKEVLGIGTDPEVDPQTRQQLELLGNYHEAYIQHMTNPYLTEAVLRAGMLSYLNAALLLQKNPSKTELLDAHWDWHVANRDGLLIQQKAMRGLNYLQPAQGITVSSMYTVFRAAVVGTAASLDARAVIPREIVVYLKGKKPVKA